MLAKELRYECLLQQ